MVYQIQAVGYVASALSAVSILPQAAKTYKEKNAEELSFGWLALTTTASALWLAYSIANKIIPTIISNIGLLITCIVILYMKLYYNGKKYNMIYYPPVVYYSGMRKPYVRMAQ